MPAKNGSVAANTPVPGVNTGIKAMAVPIAITPVITLAVLLFLKKLPIFLKVLLTF